MKRAHLLQLSLHMRIMFASCSLLAVGWTSAWLQKMWDRANPNWRKSRPALRKSLRRRPYAKKMAVLAQRWRKTARKVPKSTVYYSAAGILRAEGAQEKMAATQNLRAVGALRATFCNQGRA
jgi:hypothetical protein